MIGFGPQDRVLGFSLASPHGVDPPLPAAFPIKMQPRRVESQERMTNYSCSLQHRLIKPCFVECQGRIATANAVWFLPRLG
jgi:hypothetical protein